MIDASEALRKAVLRLAGSTGLAPLARPLLGGVGAVLMLHSVTARAKAGDGLNAHLTITPDFLDLLIASMKSDGYEFVSMDEAVARLREPRGNGLFAALTADDGYRDNLVEALPVLEKHGAPVTIYIAPALIDGAVGLWWEAIEQIVRQRDVVHLTGPSGRVVLDCSTPRQKAASFGKLLEYLTVNVLEREQQQAVREIAEAAGVDIASVGSLLDWDEIRQLAGHPLVTIGAHTVTHPNLARLELDDARAEIGDAARIIGDKIGKRPVHMAYPYGYAAAVGIREVELARDAGFVSAVTTRHGLLRTAHVDYLHALPRISINGRYQDVGHIRTMLSGITTPLANSGKVLVTV